MYNPISIVVYAAIAAAVLASNDEPPPDVDGPPPPLPPMEVCEDYNPQCPVWKHLCDDPMNRFYMQENCKETCGLCPKCEDKHPEMCALTKKLCTDDFSAEFMRKSCALTCGYCTPKVTTAPPTLPPFTEGLVGTCGISSIQQSRVINGVDAKKGAWPWQVLIKLFDQPHCGGSIISPWYIATAAHCLYKKEAITDQFSIVTGDHDFNKEEGTEMTIPAAKLIYHPKFSFKDLDFDIALIKLKWPVQFKKDVSTVCLPKKGDKLPVGTNCYITGWGKIEGYGQMHPILQQAKLPVVDNSRCNSFNLNGTNIAVSSNMVCAGFGPASPTGGCHGDSGGPFVCQNTHGNWVLQGAVSWGSGKCDTSEAYTVFSRISEYRDWMDQQMKEN